ncbi:MAG: glutamate--tRNA ligase [Chloroflexi bacterium]|jgi:glutamyl-tRNA synthetase|nr:glutamate--tRNA ligase [Chloroflexota bacterium]MBT7082120.1 glutamate--tRNA ligase [Chloroflexota bacterium]MBT7289633.1 glutamate--tRNA ligase [Chloroflexota bacterium]
MSRPVRVRFAPSPTGIPHIGNMRTALFNWLFARHSDGKFILRIEDTDQTRKVEGAIEKIYESLGWLGLEWDEGPDVGGDSGPYMQSERLDYYQSAAKRLVEQGDAYHCYCSSERLAEMRAEQSKRKEPPRYDRTCRELTAGQRAQKEAEGLASVVRYKIPFEGITSFDDEVYGYVEFQNALLDDYVILKSDGFPTYHLANVVDDHMMQISHVIRADEWLSSTPKHVLLYKALEYNSPKYAHMPMTFGKDKAKLSKRHGATALLDYKDMGYLPEAMINFLVLLGWSLDDKTEIFSRDDLIQHFSLDRISKTGAVFNAEKLNWFNGYYIRQLTTDELIERVMPLLDAQLPADVKRPIDTEYLKEIIPLIHERLKLLTEITEFVSFFFVDDIEHKADELIGKKMTQDSSIAVLEASLPKLESLAKFDTESLEQVLRPLAEELGLKTGQLFGTLRVATTGKTVAPPLFQTMEVLGQDKCLKRIGLALEKLKGMD